MIKIYQDDRITETVELRETRNRTYRERWIEPLLHPATIPFEPWVRRITENITATVPSKKFYRAAGGIVCHPAMVKELRRQMVQAGWI